MDCEYDEKSTTVAPPPLIPPTVIVITPITLLSRWRDFDNRVAMVVTLTIMYLQ